MFTYKQAEQFVDDFEILLKCKNIKIRVGSELERICLNIKFLADQQQNLDALILGTGHDLRNRLCEAVGALWLMRKLLERKDHPDFHKCISHLAVLNGEVDRFGIDRGQVAPNVPPLNFDPTWNKTFELLIALAAMGIGSNLELDDPTRSTGLNPDVLVNLPPLWGFAAKSLTSQHPQQAFEHIEKGVDQIEKSPAQRGCVLLNLSSIVTLDDVFSCNGEKFSVLGNQELAVDIVDSFIQKYRASLVASIPKDEFICLSKGKKALPSPFCFLLMAIIARTAEGPAVKTYGRWFLLFEEGLSLTDESTLQSLTLATPPTDIELIQPL